MVQHEQPGAQLHKDSGDDNGLQKGPSPPPPVILCDSPVTSVESFHFLGTTITKELKWEQNIRSLTKKAQQRMYFLRQLKKFLLPVKILVNFYTAIIESILTSTITVWFAAATARDKAKLQRVIQSAEKVIGCSLPSLQELYISKSRRHAAKIAADPSHPGNELFRSLPSGKRLRSIRTRTSRHKNSFFPTAVGCELEEKERFWSELDEVMESIPTGERVVIRADFNGHVGEGNTGDEEVMGKFGVKERNLEGQMVVDFAKRMDIGVVNTYFQKREEHRVTYKSGGRRTQVDYILCRRGNLKEISDCKVVVGESVARQHRMVVCRMTLMVCKTKRSKIEIEKKTKWWKLKKEECCEEFRQKLRQALGGQVLLPDDWDTTAEVIRETGRKVLGVSSGRRKEDKETWWWNEEVQDSIQRKRLAKKKWDMDRTEENRQEYKELQRRVKREVSKAKQKAYNELYTRLDTREGEKDLYRLARQRDQDGKDVQQKVDKIRKDEVRKVSKRMKSGKAVGLDDIPVEVWKCLGEAAVEFLASLFNRVLENLEKAYDRVPREELWYCMRKSGVAEKYVRVVQDMYERSRTVVKCAVGQTEEFKVEVGLHQALSPFLFAIVMDQLSEEVRQESPWTKMFADDIVICSESREQVEDHLERWRFALERRGMKVSRIQSNGECGKEVKKRVQAETVSLRKRQESELEVAELKMLRFSLGVTRLDRIRNEYIRGTAHVGRLGDKVREARLRWFGHVQRREKAFLFFSVFKQQSEETVPGALQYPG
ncbi:hypothetical protein QTP86_010611 [Hemibagrus guttatus]|nr:hypothetical protein QTP86_010611 [Hemibagrus guttatus]